MTTTPAPPPAASSAAPDAGPTPPWLRRPRIVAEIWILLGLSLGQSAVYAIVALVAALSQGPLKGQSTAINTSQSPRPYLDLTYQVLSIVFTLVPVVLALYLLSNRGRSATRAIGLDLHRPGKDLAWGAGLAAVIGIPGLGFYALGRAIGITVEIQASALNAYWWTVPILVARAIMNALLEEIIVVGYLHERLTDLGWGRVKFVAASSVLRGSYHLYQGWGPFFGNMAMGVLFSWFYTSRWGRRRVMPLVVAHTILDVVSFVGYALLPQSWKDALGIT
ncbi:MAG TPA: CPBP family intramembrane glutamic endopeptidase [Luteimicrobium sp.]|nr:CPBP family intramembrane glutamic endopeptidase [Luteimicrobium sp.]